MAVKRRACGWVHIAPPVSATSEAISPAAGATEPKPLDKSRRTGAAAEAPTYRIAALRRVGDSLEHQ
jgi:hypothetical protein